MAGDDADSRRLMTESVSTTASSVSPVPDKNVDIPSTLVKPTPVLEDALLKTKDFLSSLQQYQKDHEDFERKAAKELKNHSEIKQKCKSYEVEHGRTRQAHDEEVKAHTITKNRMDELHRGHVRLQEELRVATDDLAAVRLENEALRVEMEAKRQAFVVNLNLAGRHAELRNKHDELKEENDRIRADHERVQKELQAANIRLGSLSELEERAAQDAVAKKRGKMKALHALERSLAQNDQGLIQAVFFAWFQEAKTAKAQKRAKEKAMQQGVRAIASTSSGVLQMSFNDWLRAVQDEQRERLRAEHSRLSAACCSAKKQQERGRAKAVAQLEKMWGANDKRLLQQVIDGIRKVRQLRLKKDQNGARALRGIASCDSAIQATVLAAWAKTTREGRQRRQHKDRNMAKAIRMAAGGEQTLKGTIVNMWQRHTRDEKATKEKKKRGNEKAMLMIGQAGQALQAVVFQGWAACIRQEMQERREANQVTVGQRMAELQLRIEMRERQLVEAHQELHESRVKAAHITEELAKVGAFISSTPRRKISRPPSGTKSYSSQAAQEEFARPATQEERRRDDGCLPRIDSRPRSGRGSKHVWGGETAR